MNNDKEKRLDEMLDAALAEYGNAEPLHGLEERVLARLEAEPARRWAPWLRWVAAAAAIAVIAAVVLWQRPEEQKPGQMGPHQVAAPQPPPQPPQPAQPAEQARHAAAHPKAAPRVTTAHVKAQPAQPQAGRPPIVVAVAKQEALPRRDVFPTPTPPTMDEILFARHVRTTPSDIVLAEAEREPLKFHDDVPVPATNAGPQKQEATK